MSNICYYDGGESCLDCKSDITELRPPQEIEIPERGEGIHTIVWASHSPASRGALGEVFT